MHNLKHLSCFWLLFFSLIFLSTLFFSLVSTLSFLLLFVLAIAFLLTAQFLGLIRLALTITFFFFCLEVLIFTFIVFSSHCLCHDLRRFSLFHNNFDLSTAEIFDQSIEFRSLDAHKLNLFFFFTNADLHVELFGGSADAMEVSCQDVFYSEIEDRFGDEDETLFKKIKPARLCLDVGLDTWLSLFRFEMVARLDQVDIADGMQQID